jgi:hypothetical protein
MAECASQITDMMDYVQHNHTSVFKVFKWVEFDAINNLPLRFNQIKQLISLSIPVHSEKVLNRIAENMTELKYLSVNLILIGIKYFNLNNLKALIKLETLDIGVWSRKGSISLYVRELQQLKMMQIRCLNVHTVRLLLLQLPDLTPQHALNSMENLKLTDFVISRNMLQLVFRTMPNLQNLLIKNRGYLAKRLDRNKNEINRLMNLKTLNIDFCWIDENFLRNMKLPKLQSFRLFSNDTVSFSELSKIGLLYLAKQCPKLMEIRTKVSYKPDVLIASRKSADCAFNNQEVGETKNLNEVCFDDDDDNVNDDGECSDYSEYDLNFDVDVSVDDYSDSSD